MVLEESDERSESINLSEALRADAGTSIQRFTIYLPDRDRHVMKSRTGQHGSSKLYNFLAKLMAVPRPFRPWKTAWLNDTEAEPELIWESTVMNYSFIKPDSFLDNPARIREFLHRFGRQTNQGEVVFEFAGRFYLNRQFD